MVKFISLYKKWGSHLSNNNMTYGEHMMFAIGHGVICLEAGILLVTHGLFPCFFQHTGSNLVRKLKKSFDEHNEDIRNAKMRISEL